MIRNTARQQQRQTRRSATMVQVEPPLSIGLKNTPTSRRRTTRRAHFLCTFRQNREYPLMLVPPRQRKVATTTTTEMQASLLQACCKLYLRLLVLLEQQQESPPWSTSHNHLHHYHQNCFIPINIASWTKPLENFAYRILNPCLQRPYANSNGVPNPFSFITFSAFDHQPI